MRKLFAAVVAGVMTVLALANVSTASAATEFGSHCVANRAEEGESYAVIQLSQGGIPTAAPVSGVVASWKIRLIPVPFSLPQQLKVFRPTSNPSQFQVVGESAAANVISGENTFATRIPIQAGDRIGLFANSQFGALFCAETPETKSPGNSIGIFLGNPTTGSTATLFGSQSEALVPVAAVIEPDADGDGFGDETQDKCPQSAAVQAECPAVKVDASSIVKKGSVTVLVTVSSAAPVKVSGTVKLGKGKLAKLSGGTRTLAPGKLARFKLKFPAKLKSRLGELGSKQSLRLKVVASATNVAGVVSSDKLKVKLKGQG